MKNVYLLTHIYSDFETHYDTIGVYDTKELAEKAAEKLTDAGASFMDEDSEVIIEEVPMNHLINEVEVEE